MRSLVSRRVLEAAVTLLTKRDNEEDFDEADNILLSRQVSFDRVKRFFEQESKQGLVFRFEHGDLFAVDLTRVAPSRCVQQIIRRFTIDGDLSAGSRENVVIQTDIWLPDGVIEPHARQPLGPTIVIEVADSESLKSLYRCATTYLHASTTIQMVICVKVWSRDSNGNRAMLFMLFERNNMVITAGYVQPTRVISFGDADLHPISRNHLIEWGVPTVSIRGRFGGSLDPACIAPNQPLYQVTIGAGEVYHSSALDVPSAFHNGYTIDLFDIQRVVQRW